MSRTVGSVRPCIYSNRFYSSVGSELESEISMMVDQQKGEACQLDEVYAAVVPHAGLAYSNRGSSQALAHRLAPVSFALILAPSHHYHILSDRIVGDTYTTYHTPLGDLRHAPLDITYPVMINNSFTSIEHAVEMPLLHLAYQQKRQGSDIGVEVLLTSSFSSSSAVDAAAVSITEAMQRKGIPLEETLILASSDITHWGNLYVNTPYSDRPEREILSRVRDDDTVLINSFLSGSNPVSRPQHSTMCGYGAFTLLSRVARLSGLRGILQDYYTSKDIVPQEGGSGDSFVTYASVLFGR